jgi:hypothetical protein
MFDISPRSKGNRFRARRVAALRAMVDEVLAAKGSCAIIDLGGTADFWATWREEFDFSRTSVTCINVDAPHGGSSSAGVSVRVADATHMPEYSDNHFDICFSNSVIEHVGDWRKMRAFAGEAKRLAPTYLIQTPYFWFPIEPHARALFIHWLPESWGYRLLMRKRHGFWRKQETVLDAVAQWQSARMLDYRQFSALFDDAVVSRERFVGLTKSLIATRHASQPLATRP